MKLNTNDLEAIINIIKTKKCTYKSSERTNFYFDFYAGKIFRKKKIKFGIWIYKPDCKEYHSTTITSEPYWGKPNISFRAEVKNKKQIGLINKALGEMGLLKGKKIEYDNFINYMNKLENK